MITVCSPRIATLIGQCASPRGKKWEDLQHARRAAVEHCSGAALLAAPVAVGAPHPPGPHLLPLK